MYSLSDLTITGFWEDGSRSEVLFPSGKYGDRPFIFFPLDMCKSGRLPYKLFSIVIALC